MFKGIVHDAANTWPCGMGYWPKPPESWAEPSRFPRVQSAQIAQDLPSHSPEMNERKRPGKLSKRGLGLEMA